MSTSSKLLAPTRSRRAASAASVFALLFALTLLACATRAQDANAAARPSPSPAPATDANAAAKATKGNAGAITGRVLGDGGEPLAGASVIVRTPSANRSNFEPLAVTDDAGNFRLDNLAPGVYQVGASVRGLVPDPEAYPPGRPTPLYRPGDSVTIRLVRGGALTGTVTGGDGEPLVAISVRAVYVRDLEGDTASAGYTFGTDQTDDRGVYRIYGLRQGVYAVAAGSEATGARGPGSVTAYENESPTYYPSGTRDTAAEVTVRNGQETAGIDIRHRGERGRRVTGLVMLGQEAGSGRGVFVTLTHAATGTQVATAFTPPGAGATAGTNERPFAFDAVAEGEYEVQARSSDAGVLLSTSPPQRVVVGAADATGLRLTLTPLASISGSLIIQPSGEAERAKGECKDRHTSILPQESLVAAQQEDLPKRGAAARSDTVRRETSPESSGEFTLRSLEPGRYRFDLRLADDNWYVREVQLPAPAAPATTRPGAAARAARPAAANSNAAADAPAPRETVELKSGQRLAGVLFRLAEGAASLAGRVAPREGNAPLPPSSQLRVHLVPADREQAENSLRYAETSPAPDGTFSFRNLAPGRYLLLVRAADAEERARPAAWDAASRARLRREAEAANTSVELEPCRQLNDFALRFPQAPVK